MAQRFAYNGRMKKLIVTILTFILPLASWSMNTELSYNYSFKKTTFDSDNYTEGQSSTGSMSLYFWERIALELSYTNGLYVKYEKSTSNPLVRTTTQTSNVYGADLILVLADKKAAIQPYIKGGTAYITKKQTIQDQGYPAETIESPAGMAPSYGVGLKIFITEAFAIRMGYDAVITPIDKDNKVTDVSSRVGVSWFL